MTAFQVQGRHGVYTVESDPISRGGVGSIHRTADPAWVYKKYFVPDKAPKLSNLDQLINVGRAVLIRDGRAPGETPESSVNWPVDISVVGGRAQGVILPTIPSSLFNEFGKARGLEFLVMARGNPPTAKGRIALLLRMAEILNFVDSRRLVHGDINGKNLAWTIAPTPVMYLIDCDGMVPQEPSPTEGVQAMGWTDPRVMDHLIPAHDKYSDWHALALAMYRGLLLTPGKLDSRQPDGSWPKPKAIPADMDPRIAALLRRGLSDPLNADSRPTPAEWVQGLVAAFLDNGRFNESATQKLDRLSATVAATKPTFTQLPTINWTQVLSGTQTTRPPSPSPPGNPIRPSFVQQTPAPPKPTFRPPTPGPPQTTGRGRLAARALQGGTAWHVRGVLSCICLPYVAVVYIGIAIYQLRGLKYPRAETCRKILYAYGVLAVVVLVIALSSS